MELIAIFLLSLAVPAGAAVALDGRWPEAPRRRIVLASAAIVPAMLLAFIIYLLADVTGSGSDVAGLAAAVYVLFGPVVALVSFVVGMAAGSATIQLLRARDEP